MRHTAVDIFPLTACTRAKFSASVAGTMILPTPACAARCQAGLFIATKRREIKMAVGVDKTANQARSSLLNVGSFAWRSVAHFGNQRIVGDWRME